MREAPIDPHPSWIATDGDPIAMTGWSPYSGRTLWSAAAATYGRRFEVAQGGDPGDEELGRFVLGSGARS
jgi:hypothetical protein